VGVRPAEQTALLVIRVWFEPSGEPRLRARITQTFDLDHPATTSSVAATREDIAAAVEHWLDLLTGDGALTDR
jgi:hypothetical protein